MSKELDQGEALLTEAANRFVLFPIKYDKIWQMYKKAEAAFWTAEEIDLSKDMNDWERLTENERYFIKQVLAFFAGSDGIVNENLSARFMHEVKPQEAKSFYGFQIAMENIHCVTGDTEVYTRNGYIPIKSLVGKTVDVWNGETFSTVSPLKTGTSVPVFRVRLSNGMHLDCTSQHKWVIRDHEDRVFTEDLKPGMQLAHYAFPEYHCQSDLDVFSNPHEHGFMAFCTSSDKEYIPTMFDCRDRYDVPVNYSIATKTRWLSGALSQAIITLDNYEETITLQTTHLSLLKNTQLLLTTLGVHSIRSSNKITINRHYAYKLSQFTNVNLTELTPMYELDDVHITVESIEPLPNPQDTFCFEEPGRHMGVFNGILTGQSETYSVLIDTYIKDPQEKGRLLNAINTIPCIRKKADWAVRWIEDKDASFAMRLVAFACVEGIFFSGAFCAIFWLKERGVMPGLCLSNEFISRDEALHTEFAVLLYSMLDHKLPQELIHKIVAEAVEIEDEFINDSIPCRMLGMNSDLMSQYIKFVADRLLVQLGYERIWNVPNPFDFMDRINLEHKANFFEDRNSQYSLANVGNTEKHTAFEFNEDTDF